jgi:hypothetical protein
LLLLQLGYQKNTKHMNASRTEINTQPGGQELGYHDVFSIPVNEADTGLVDQMGQKTLAKITFGGGPPKPGMVAEQAVYLVQRTNPDDPVLRDYVAQGVEQGIVAAQGSRYILIAAEGGAVLDVTFLGSTDDSWVKTKDTFKPNEYQGSPLGRQTAARMTPSTQGFAWVDNLAEHRSPFSEGVAPVQLNIAAFDDIVLITGETGDCRTVIDAPTGTYHKNPENIQQRPGRVTRALAYLGLNPNKKQ